MSEDIIVERSGGVVRVTLNRPARRNAMLPQMWGQLADIVDEVESRPGDRVLVLTGAGGAFCSGADLAGRLHSAPNVSTDMSSAEVLAAGKRCVLALANMSKASIAAVDGGAVGGGCNLALACDLVVASDRAQFSEIFVRREMVVDMGGSWFLPRIVGDAFARRLVLLGEFVDAQLAFQLGLATHLASADEFDCKVNELAQQLAEVSELSLRANKRLLAESSSLTLAEALDRETHAQLDMLTAIRGQRSDKAADRSPQSIAATASNR